MYALFLMSLKVMISTVAFDQNGSCDVVNWTFMEQLSGDQAALVTDRH